MMLKVSDLVQVLKAQYPDIKFFNGCISRDEKCVGVYARGNATPISAIGTIPSYNVLPVTLLVHWSENSDDCETTANRLYEGFEAGIKTINNARVVRIQMMDSAPVNIGRDDGNICEMTLRINIFYERR